MQVSKAVLLFIDNFLICQHLTKQKHIQQHKHVPPPSHKPMLTDSSLAVHSELIKTTLASHFKDQHSQYRVEWMLLT